MHNTFIPPYIFLSIYILIYIFSYVCVFVSTHNNFPEMWRNAFKQQLLL